MSWSAPRTWVTGETLTSTLMNTHLRDQFLFIHDQGGDLASATTITITNLFHKITGSTSIQTVSGGAAGHVLTLVFGATVTLIHGTGNLRLYGAIHGGFAAGESVRLVHDGTNWYEIGGRLVSGQFVNLGTVTPPAGLLARDGSAPLRAGYAALFAAIGTSYGAGDGTTTFTLPDSRGRATVALGTHADVDALSDNDAVAVANRSPKHNTTLHNAVLGDSSDGFAAFTERNHQRAAGYATIPGVYLGPGGTLPVDTPAYDVAGGYIRI